MMKQYPLRIDDTIYRKAKSKAALEGISMKDLITELLQMWGDGRIQLTKRLHKNERMGKATGKSGE